MPEPYRLEVSPAAQRDLKRLPRDVQEKVVLDHLPSIAKAPFLTSTPLIGGLKGERSYHFGRRPEYRIIFYVEDDLVTVTIMGTREGIYRRARRRGR
jgi:mRNA-degrading endonuclease RelE of RelBE toxin-antitoxin system